MEGTSEEGAGGKIQKSVVRNRNATPYQKEKQVTQPPNPNLTPASKIQEEIRKAFKDGEDTWIYKACDFFLTRVENFFAYMFRGTVDLAAAQTRQKLQAKGAPPSVPSSELRERATGSEGDRLNNSTGDIGIDVLEKLIKETTFTKAQIDHLTEVIRSKIAGKSNLVKLIKENTFTKAEIDHLTELMLSRIVGESTQN